MTTNFQALESYIADIGAIHEGERNDTLYQTGLRLCGRFKLHDDELRHNLHRINSTKCKPPLEDDEVETIVASVEKSDVSLGSTADAEPASETYYLPVDLSPCSIDEYLAKEISIYVSATAEVSNETVTIRQLIEDCRSGKYQDLIEKIRAEQDKKQRNELKKRLPCVTIQSEVCEQRTREYCKNNSLVCLDFDGIDDVEEAKRKIAALPYVLAVITSASGRGLFVLVALAEPVENLRPVLKAIQEDFEYPIDKACSNVSRLRYVSFDPDLIVKDSVTPWSGKRESMSDRTGIDVLDTFIDHVTKIAFPVAVGKKVKASDYYITGIANLFATAKELQLDIGLKNESPHVFNGQFWQRIEQRTFRHFMQIVGVRQGTPHGVIKDHSFVDKLMKQFWSEARFPVQASNDTPKMNLQNGTLHFTSDGAELRPFDKQDGLTYQLPYAYDPSATAPLFRKFLDRVLPDVAMQKLIFQYIGYVFLPSLNLEKVLFLLGDGSNGKSVFLNVIRGLIGDEQCCSFSLEDLSQKSGYNRAELGNYVLNVDTENSARMATEMFKKIVSREPLQARHPYGRPFVLRDYATSVFAMNKLPKDVEQTGAFFRRFIIVPFEVVITDDEKDPDLAKKIIANEMSGVLNYVVDGVRSLLEEGDFDIPESVREVVEEFRQESDTVYKFMERFQPGKSESIPLKAMHDHYRALNPNGVTIRDFSKRLRSLGYTVDRAGRNNTVSVYVIRRMIDDVSVEFDGDFEALAQVVSQ